MKKTSNPLRAIALSCLFIILSAGDCDESINVGYYYVSVPSYEIEDYARMLLDPNPEIQYNAICALYEIVETKYLDEDSLKHTPEHDRDLAIYNRIFRMMDSGNSWISSAAIRYAGEYTYNHDRYMGQVLSNNNPSVNVQLAIRDKFRYRDPQNPVETGLLARKIDFCYSHPSWLVRSGVYDYMTPLLAHRYEERLWHEYRQAGSQHEKLLALRTLGNHKCDTVLTLIEQEYDRTQDTNVRKLIVELVIKAPDKARILRWFRDRPAETLQALKMTSGFSLFDSTSVYAQMLSLALNQGMDPLTLKSKTRSAEGQEEYPTLFDLLFQYKYETEEIPETTPLQKETIALIEEKIAANPETQRKWLAYTSTRPTHPLPDALVREQLKITESYNRALTKLYDRYNVDSSLYKTYIKEMPSLYSSLTGYRLIKQPR